MPEEFTDYAVTLSSGEIVQMKLAERGVNLGGVLWLREIRKLTQSGHQTSILSTDYLSDLRPLACAMFARWSQENFFRYMREHFGLDRLIDYSIEQIPETTKVVNPQYRECDTQVRSKRALLGRKTTQFGALSLTECIEPKHVETYEQKKAKLREEITTLENELAKLKETRKGIASHINIAQLPEGQRFGRLKIQSKHLIDTIKMIAYRAETTMAQIVREKMSRTDDARSLLKALYSTEADLIPHEKQGTLTVRLHHLANHCSDEAIQYLCAELNATETFFPDTHLRLIYELGSSHIPRGKEV